MATRIVGESDADDAIQAVAERMLKRGQAAKPTPRNLGGYVSRSVLVECFRLYRDHRNGPVDIDDLPIAGEFIGRDAPVEVESLMTTALDQISPRDASQAKLTYWREVPVRDFFGRGCPTGTAARRTMLAREQLREVEETHEAAHALGIGLVEFEPLDRDAWARERAKMNRTCSGMQTLELIDVWTSLALRQGTDLEAVEDWALRIVGATTEQMDVAEILIGQHWARMREGAEVRGAA